MKPKHIAVVLVAFVSAILFSVATFANNANPSQDKQSKNAVSSSDERVSPTARRVEKKSKKSSIDSKKNIAVSHTDDPDSEIAKADEDTNKDETRLIRKTVDDYNKDASVVVIIKKEKPRKRKLSGAELLKQADANSGGRSSSPVRRISRNHNASRAQARKNYYFRTIDGSDNNLVDHSINETETQLIRKAEADYSDDISAFAGVGRPNPRTISNNVHAQQGTTETYKLASDMLWQWGQFLDHDIDLTDGVEPAEPEPIAVPPGDAFFDPNNTGAVEMAFNRSIYDEDTGISSPRQQINEITGWIDASNVYGSDLDRANALRTLDGSGRLKTSEGDFLPFNTTGQSNAGGSSDTLFLAGDVRANEQVALTTMHTLFMREHNRLAKQIKRTNGRLSGDEIYQLARRIVAAQMQVITYNEFLPILLGENALAPYEGYKPEINATIANEFSTAAFRFGHSLLSPQLLRLNREGEETSHGHLALRDAFFSPHRISDEGGIEPILRGLASQTCQDLDELIIDDVRNFLFGRPGSGGFDLASLNIQRGRDHGLSGYNATRVAYGLPAVESFADITSDPNKQQKLSNTYAAVDDIDLWVGGLIEDKVENALVGETFFAILKDQFERLRDGDRFWYQKHFNGFSERYINRTTLAKIIRRNTEIGREVPNNVFLVQ